MQRKKETLNGRKIDINNTMSRWKEERKTV